jgi:hypothetical protein
VNGWVRSAGQGGGIGRCFGLEAVPITETDSRTDTGHQDHNTPERFKHLKSLVLGRGRVAAGVAAGVASAAVAGIWARAAALIGIAVGVGIAAAVIIGLISSAINAAWPCYGIAWIGLGLRRRLPWRLMGFLADSHRRGVLRQVGAVYQFRHIELQHRLANPDAEKRQVNSSAAPPEADE